MSRIWKWRSGALVLAVLIFVVDQWIKNLMIGTLNLRQVGQIEIVSFFNLTWTQNFGVSLGMFTATSPEMRWGLVLATSAIALVVLVWLLREKLWPELLGLAMILGGAAGNIRDRIEYGYVVDYADLHFGDFRPFLVFNVADAAITIGVVIILARALFMREKPAAPEGGDQEAVQSAETQ
jgi:signal peptidase II